MFVNEYVMTRKRYDKWATPKFWKAAHFLYVDYHLCRRIIRLVLL